jgi:hypothetical protein
LALPETLASLLLCWLGGRSSSMESAMKPA